MGMSKPNLLVVICSTRPGRVGKPVGDWFSEQARADGRFNVDVADLAELDLPFLDEPNHPAKHAYTKEHTKDWSAQVVKADAVVWVMPEYNHTLNAPMKNAIDFLFWEWQKMATGFVSYGGVSAGLRAVVGAQTPLLNVGSVVTAARVTIPFVATQMKDGAYSPTEEVAISVTPMLDELAGLVEVLGSERAGIRDKIATLAAGN